MLKTPAPLSLLCSGLLAIGISGSGCSTNGVTRTSSTTLQVNEFTSSKQAHVAVAVDASDRVLVAWDSRRQQGGRYGIYARWVDLAGHPLTSEFQVNEHVRGHQMQPAVAVGPWGDAWIAWTSTGQDGQAGGIVARRLASGTWSPEQAVNETRTGHQRQPSVAVNRSGEVLVTWMTDTPEGARVAARGFASDGSALGSEFQLGAKAEAALPRVVALPDDRFAVTWQETDGKPSGLFLQVVDSCGEHLGSVQPIADAGAIEASIDAHDQGAIMAWLEPRGDRHGVVMQRISAAGTPLGQPMELEPPVEPASWISGVHVVARPEGEWTLAWNENREGLERDRVRLQDFHRDGTPVSAATWMDESLAPGHHLSIASTSTALAVSSQGSRVIGFSGRGSGPDSSAANVAVLDGGASEARAAPPVPVQTVAMVSADTPNPPVFDPDFIPLEPTPRDRGAGDHDFEGMTYTGWTPPDPDIAVGPNHVVEVINGGIAAWTLDGTLLFQEAIEDSGGFWGSVGAPSFVFDPEVIWDPHARRFVAMANARDGSLSYFLLAVSDGEDADGEWYKYRIDVSSFDDSIDSPNLAVDDRAIYLSADFFSPDKYLILCVDKAPALVGDPLTWNQLSLTGSGEQSLGMPVTWDAGRPQYLLQSSEGTGNGIGFNEIRIWSIADPLGSPTMVSYDLPVETYSYPAEPPQQGTSSRPFLFEPRFWSCIQRNGSIWAVHHVNSSRARVRWYEIDLQGWPDTAVNPVVAQWGEIDAGAGISTYFPSITVDENNNAAVTFARSSSSEYISMWSALRSVDDPAGEFQEMELVRESSAPDTSGRWGDYSGASPWPDAPGRFWLGHEWISSTGGWRTWITEATLIESPLYFDYPLGRPALLDPAGGSTVTVTITPGAADPVAGMIEWNDGVSSGDIDLVLVTGNDYEAVFPALECGAQVHWHVSVEASDGVKYTSPSDAPATTWTSDAWTGIDVIAQDTFESDLGWTVGGTATDGQWEIGVPAGDGDRCDPVVDGDGSGACALTDNVAGNSDVDGGATILVSPVMDASEATGLRYWRWYSNGGDCAGGSPGADVFLVEVSENAGLNWQTLETVGPTGSEVSGGWFQVEFDFADFPTFTPNSQFRVRFTASDTGNGSVIEAAVDGVELFSPYCDTSTCPGDVTGDNQVNVDDILAVISAWGPCPDCPEDINGDGVVAVEEVLVVLDTWGACP